MTEDEMVGLHHCLDGHEFEQTTGDWEWQGNLVCCSPWGSQSQTRLSDWITINSIDNIYIYTPDILLFLLVAFHISQWLHLQFSISNPARVRVYLHVWGHEPHPMQISEDEGTPWHPSNSPWIVFFSQLCPDILCDWGLKTVALLQLPEVWLFWVPN